MRCFYLCSELLAICVNSHDIGLIISSNGIQHNTLLSKLFSLELVTFFRSCSSRIKILRLRGRRRYGIESLHGCFFIDLLSGICMSNSRQHGKVSLVIMSCLLKHSLTLSSLTIISRCRVNRTRIVIIAEDFIPHTTSTFLLHVREYYVGQ